MGSFGFANNNWAKVEFNSDGKRLIAWDGYLWRYEWPIFSSVKQLVQFARKIFRE